ncbi:MAG: hypothetical protein QM820_62435 [Minicystis sp.]
MRTLFLACSATLVTALTFGCGGGNENPTGSGTGTGSGGSAGHGGSGGIGGDGGSGNGGSGGALADPTKGQWRDGFGVPGLGGFGGRASSIVRGKDGRIYVGGIFTDAAGVAAHNVVVWDGTSWAPLGDGLPGFVNALAFGPDGALYAGGWLGSDTDPSNHLARWDGTAWAPIPGEVTGKIRALATMGDRLLVAAESGDIAGLGTAGIASYSAANGWEPIDGSGADFDVDTILVTGADTFCIGGVFGSVDGVTAANAACWDGTAWSQLGDGLPGGVSRLAKGPDGTFYAGGTLTYILDPITGAYSSGIASLKNGVWTEFHGGIDKGYINEVRAIAFASDGDLLVGGTFGVADASNPVPASHLARYDFQGGGWSELGGGVQNDVGLSIGSVEGVNDMLVLADGTIWVGGLYSSANHGKVQTANIAALKDTSWQVLVPAGKRFDGVAGLLNDMAADAQGRVVAGGHFTGVGGVQANNVARYGKDGWEALGAGTNDTVRAVVVQKNGTIVIGGDFTKADNKAATFVARWDGTTWSALGGGFDGPVTALAEDAQGALYAGGDFIHAGSAAANHIARWDGSHWTPLGKGLDDRVTSLIVDHSGNVVATGLFRNSDTTAVNGLATWDGTTWKSFGTGFGDFEYGSRVVATPDGFAVGGSFKTIDGQAIAGLARWDGKAWSAYGPGLSGNSGLVLVTDMAAYGKGLFATGIFDKAGSADVGHLAYWDGSSWHALGAGIDDLAESMVVAGTSLYVGGAFLQAGGKISTGIAAWDFTP